jgi:hypothetical protein
MKQAGLCALLGALVLVFTGCGGSGEKKGEEETPSAEATAACNGSQLADAGAKLPPSFPQIEEDKLTYTRQRTEGPTNIVEGYFHGDVKEAHDEFKKELQGAGFKILFDEVEEHDSEVSWEGEGRTGQVALREECGDSDKTYVHITNRPE